MVLNIDWTTIKYRGRWYREMVRRMMDGTKAMIMPTPCARRFCKMYMFAGSISNGSNDDIGVIKYDSSGALQWVRPTMDREMAMTLQCDCLDKSAVSM